MAKQPNKKKQTASVQTRDVSCITCGSGFRTNSADPGNCIKCDHVTPAPVLVVDEPENEPVDNPYFKSTYLLVSPVIHEPQENPFNVPPTWNDMLRVQKGNGQGFYYEKADNPWQLWTVVTPPDNAMIDIADFSGVVDVCCSYPDPRRSFMRGKNGVWRWRFSELPTNPNQWWPVSTAPTMNLPVDFRDSSGRVYESRDWEQCAWAVKPDWEWRYRKLTGIQREALGWPEVI